jgi:hypothetical protein
MADGGTGDQLTNWQGIGIGRSHRILQACGKEGGGGHGGNTTHETLKIGAVRIAHSAMTAARRVGGDRGDHSRTEIGAVRHFRTSALRARNGEEDRGPLKRH